MLQKAVKLEDRSRLPNSRPVNAFQPATLAASNQNISGLPEKPQDSARCASVPPHPQGTRPADNSSHSQEAQPKAAPQYMLPNKIRA